MSDSASNRPDQEMVHLDGGQFTDIDTFLFGALTLSGATGLPFEMTDIGRIAGAAGLTARHLAALRAMARLCNATVEGDAITSKKIRFTPRGAPRRSDMIVDIGEVSGRPSPLSVMPLAEMLLPVLTLASGDSFVRFRGANATPFAPSGFWLRETLMPMLRWAGIDAAIEVEKWGWYPDGSGEVTLLVTGHGALASSAALHWPERGDPVELWALVALSPRANRRLGKQMTLAVQQALAREPIPLISVEEARVRSPGPGGGLFLSLHCEHVSTGFEAVVYQGMSGDQLAEEATSALSSYFWSDAAFDAELGRALLIPLALTHQEASFTATEATLPMRVLEFLIPRFLPVRLSISNHPTGVQVQIRPQ